MSKTFASRPTAVRPAGRGRGATSQTTQPNAGRGRGPTPSRSTIPTQTTSTRTRSTMAGGQAPGTFPNEMSSGEPAPSQGRVHHAGAYTVIQPNEEKRRKIREMAEKETAQYENWKQQRKPSHVSYVGTVGGGLSEGRARQQIQQSHPTRTQRLMQQQQRRDGVRQREEQQLAERKVQARKKTEENGRNELEREARLREDMRRKNNAFLDRLEGKRH